MYQTVGQAIGVVWSLAAILVIDIIGRRPLFIFGALMLVVCNVIIGSIGPKTPNLTSAEEGVVVASIMLLLSGTKISFQMGACGYIHQEKGQMEADRAQTYSRPKSEAIGCERNVGRVILQLSKMLKSLSHGILHLCRHPDPIRIHIRRPVSHHSTFEPRGEVRIRHGLHRVEWHYLHLLPGPGNEGTCPRRDGRAVRCESLSQANHFCETPNTRQMNLWPWQWRSAVTTGEGSAVARAERHEADADAEKMREIEHVSALTRMDCTVPEN